MWQSSVALLRLNAWQTGETKMRTITAVLTLLLVAATATSRASILESKQITIDFTNSTDATTKATWSEPDRITVSKGGLGWHGDGAASRDGWIQTKSLPLGLSWRPTYVISARVAIQPSPAEITLNNGQKTTPDAGDVYVRYSPDRRHWSSWQALQRSAPQSVEEKKTPGRYYSGTIRVPYRERSEYSRLVSDYSRLDVPWQSDEEAAVQWILGRDPDFFSKHIPFIGYAEILFETGFRGGQRIQSLRAEISYGMGGMHSIPRDEAVYKNRFSSPWRFEAKENSRAEPVAPTGGASPRR
jgi:hypothetical protein